MVVRAKRRMITRAKTKGELALMKSRMQRLQKERVREEFEEADITQTGQRAPSRRRPSPKSRKKTRVEIDQETHLGSSLVLSLQAKRASPSTVDIYVHFPSDWYAIIGIPIILYNRWERGDAKATTDDIRRYKSGKKKGQFKKKRWWKGKYPSMGAFYNQHIKGRYPHIAINGPPSGATDVFDDDNDVYGEEVGGPINNG